MATKRKQTGYRLDVKYKVVQEVEKGVKSQAKIAVFDPSIPVTDEHKLVHAEYKALIDTLLESYCEDNDITINDALEGIKRMSDMPEIKEVFMVVFEQVWAANDFNIFTQVMCKRNLAIQELALKLLIQATGVVPETFQTQNEPVQSSSPQRGASTVMATEKNEEEELLRRALEESKRDEERNKKKRMQEEQDLKNTLELSKTETIKKQEEQKSLEKSMQKLLVSEPLPAMPGASRSAPASSSFASPARPKPESVGGAAPRAQPVKAGAFGITPKGGPSGAEAANNWLKSAMEEAHTSETHKAVMAQMQQMTPDELKRRQEYLKEQREKLLKMKQQEREKQLSTAVKANPGRPQSARAARAALANQGTAPPSQVTSEEEEKRIAMRRAIADKLRMEVIGKP